MATKIKLLVSGNRAVTHSNTERITLAVSDNDTSNNHVDNSMLYPGFETQKPEIPKMGSVLVLPAPFTCPIRNMGACMKTRFIIYAIIIILTPIIFVIGYGISLETMIQDRYIEHTSTEAKAFEAYMRSEINKDKPKGLGRFLPPAPNPTRPCNSLPSVGHWPGRGWNAYEDDEGKSEPEPGSAWWHE